LLDFYPGRCPGLVCCCPFRAKKNNIRLYEKRILFTGNFGYTLMKMLDCHLPCHFQLRAFARRDNNKIRLKKGFLNLNKNYLTEIFSLASLFWEKTITKMDIKNHQIIFPISIFIKLFPQFEKGSLIFGIQIAQIFYELLKSQMNTCLINI